MEIVDMIMQKIDLNREVERLGGFPQDMQILHLVTQGIATPKLLMEKMGIQKTNLSLLCRRLLDDKLISKMRSEENKKSIAYCISAKGKAKLASKLNEMRTLNGE